VLTGVALAALAAAAVAAAVNHRRGMRPDSDEHAHLDELDVRLSAAQQPGTTQNGMARLLDGLLRNRGISIGRLRTWVHGVRQGSLSSEQAVVAESDFAALEREADQSGM
jgi:hypothetical protein